jgi:RluA family pseudouridine synthase
MIPVVYEDAWLLVANKPSGLLTVPTPRKEKRTLTSILNLYPCHRLDRETSGLIIYAKEKSVQQKMMQAFKQRKVKKKYLALVNGNPRHRQGEIDFPIEGQAAQTQYRVLAQKRGFAVVEARPFTGRTNQLRIHFKRIGHPILGDCRFAFRRDFLVKAKRLMLHAQELEFNHPLTGKQLYLSADVPEDMRALL